MGEKSVSKFIVIIRPEFMTFCQDACRAATLNHLLFRIAGKCKDQPKEKIQAGEILWYLKNEDITSEMSHAWGVCKTGKEVNELVKMNLLGRCSNPEWGVDRTKHFFFGTEQCATFLKFYEEQNLCFVHADLSDEVKHLIYSSNANDKSIKCKCVIHQMHSINLSDAFDKSIEAITKIDYKENTKNNTREDYVSADAERTHASSESENTHVHVSASSLPQLAGYTNIPAHGSNHVNSDGNNHPHNSEVARQAQLNNNHIATTDTQTTLQAEQERENHATSTRPTNISSRASLATGGTDHHRGDVRSQPVSPVAPEKQADTTTAQGARHSDTQIGDSHNGHGGLRNHGTGDSGGGATLLPLVPMDGDTSAAGTQAGQEVIPIGVDKQQGNGDKSSGKRKPVVPTGPLVMPPDDARWCAETAVQMIEARKGRRYGETTRKQELAKASEALRYEIDGKPITRAQFTRAWEQMESWPLWVEKHITPMIKHLVKDDRIVTLLQQKRKAISGAVRHGPDTEMIEYEGEMMTRDQAMARGYSDFDIYIGNGKAEREAMVAEAKKDPLFWEIINDGKKAG